MKRLLLPALLVGFVLGCGQRTGPMGGEPVRHWAEQLRSPDWRLRKKAVFKLGNMATAEAWPVVCGVLQDPDPHVRAEAVGAVLKFGPTSQEAVRALTELKQIDPDATVRSLAGQALDKVQRDYGKD